MPELEGPPETPNTTSSIDRLGNWGLDRGRDFQREFNSQLLSTVSTEAHKLPIDYVAGVPCAWNILYFKKM